METKYKKFLDGKKKVGEKIEEFIWRGDSEINFDKFSQSINTKNLSTFYNDIHEKDDHLDSYKKYLYYQKNYIEKKENLDLHK